MPFTRFTRFLHFLVVMGIGAQLLLTLVMVHPHPGHPGNEWFEVHEMVGLAMAGLLVVYWVHTLFRSGDISFGRLFPWFSGQRLALLREDIRLHVSHMARFTLPENRGAAPLPGAVQGLGLLCALLLGLTGVAVFLGMAENGVTTGWIHDAKEVHESFGPLMWTYLVVHAAMGFLHQLSDGKTLSDMMRFWVRHPETRS